MTDHQEGATSANLQLVYPLLLQYCKACGAARGKDLVKTLNRD